MDQPTNIEVTISGKSEEVKRAAIAAQKYMDSNTRGFNDAAYRIDDNNTFESILDEAIDIMGDYDFEENSGRWEQVKLQITNKIIMYA